MKKFITVSALSFGLLGCGHIDKYEEGVAEYEPTYCYAALGGGVECFREPVHADERRLVNYYGKHPSRYDKPEAPARMEPQAPPMINAWVKDAEPVVRAMPKGDPVDRPWLASGYQAPAPSQASPQATEALLRQAHEHLSQSIEKHSQERLKSLSQAKKQRDVAADAPVQETPPFR